DDVEAPRRHTAKAVAPGAVRVDHFALGVSVGLQADAHVGEAAMLRAGDAAFNRAPPLRGGQGAESNDNQRDVQITDCAHDVLLGRCSTLRIAKAGRPPGAASLVATGSIRLYQAFCFGG